MKKFLIILALVFAVAQVNAAVDSTSVRLKGINDDLNGILLDEYTDALINPADILRADGW